MERGSELTPGTAAPVRQRSAPGFTPRCPECGYDLTSLPDGRCPECGAPFELTALVELHLARARAEREGGRSAAAAVLAVASVLFVAYAYDSGQATGALAFLASAAVAAWWQVRMRGTLIVPGASLSRRTVEFAWLFLLIVLAAMQWGPRRWPDVSSAFVWVATAYLLLYSFRTITRRTALLLLLFPGAWATTAATLICVPVVRDWLAGHHWSGWDYPPYMKVSPRAMPSSVAIRWAVWIILGALGLLAAGWAAWLPLARRAARRG